MKELERHFRPEFIGRLDDVIVLRPLGRLQLETIVEHELRKVNKRLTEHGLRIEISGEVKDLRIDKRTSANLGARPAPPAFERRVSDAATGNEVLLPRS